MKPTDARSAYRLQRIVELLADHNRTQTQLAQAMHVTRPQSLAAYLDYLVGKRRAHVVAWTEPAANGRRAAIYRWGRGKNAKCPPPKSHAQLMKEYWARKKKVRQSAESACVS